MSSEKTVINMSLLIWCFVVIAELFILAWLLHSGLVLLFVFILISPITAAFKWPLQNEIEQNNKNLEPSKVKAK